jgi:hypothetical protein
MMKVNNWLVVFLILMGFAVGIVSLYMASLTGVMGKMGLVGGDFTHDIDNNELARQLRDKGAVKCGLWQVARRVPEFLMTSGEGKINLAGELGEERVVCGVDLVQRGNVERGVYSIIKGLYYLRGQYNELNQLVRQDSKNCELLAQTQYEHRIQGYLRATQGRVHDLVFDLYKQVESERAGVDELCGD